MRLDGTRWAIISFTFFCLMAGSMWLGYIYHGKTRCPQIPFDSTLWQNDDAVKQIRWNEPSIRQGMIRSLVTEVLPGKSRNEIVEILFGKRSLAEGIDKNYPRGEDIVQSIGIERVFITDSNGEKFSPSGEYLVISFDENDQFRYWRIDGSRKWADIVGHPGSTTYLGVDSEL